LLHFFTTQHDLPEIKTESSTPFTLKNSAKFKNKIIPFSHIYVSTVVYKRRIKRSLDQTHHHKLIELREEQRTQLLNHHKFPVELKTLSINSIKELYEKIAVKRDVVDIVVLNGFGTAFGDNYAGLAIIQRLTNFFKTTQVRFHLMQNENAKMASVYRHEKNVYTYNNCIPANIFLKMDFYVNLTGMLGLDEFNQMPLSHFMANMMSAKNILPHSNLKPILYIKNTKKSNYRQKILDRYKQNDLSSDQKIFLLHPKASSRLRTMNARIAKGIVKELTQKGYLVISAIEYNNKPQGLIDCSDLSNSFDDLIHIISACDAVISVGTATYHLAAALNKPTVLLPTVFADIHSGELLPEVLTYLQEDSKHLISDKHKSREQEDVDIAHKIWNNIKLDQFTQAFEAHINNSHLTPAKVGVVIPHFGTQEKLNTCLDALIKVDGFDPLYLYVVDNNKGNRYFTAAVNTGISQALNDGCDYVWVLNNDTQPDKNYITACLDRFSQNDKVGIIGGKNLMTEKPDYIFWGGSHQVFPTGVHKTGYISKNSLNTATQESWATFSSVIIRRDTLADTSLLDQNMGMIFSDSDYCFVAALHGWETWYEPKAVLLHDTGVTRKIPNQHLIDIFRADKRYFYQKWSTITEEKDPEKLQQAIFDKVGWEGKVTN